MAPLDDQVTTILQRKKRRKIEAKDRIAKHQLMSVISQAATNSTESNSTEESLSCSTEDDDSDAVQQKNVSSVVDETSTTDVEESSIDAKVKQQRRRLTNVVKASERHAVSDRAVAEITSAVLEGYGILNSEDYNEVIDRSKIKRERHSPWYHIF